MGHLRTYAEVARTYGVTTRTVRRWADKGAVEVVRSPSGRPRVVVEADESGHFGHNRLDDDTATSHTHRE